MNQYWPLELRQLRMQDLIGMDAIARHQRLLAEAATAADHVLFVVEKDLTVSRSWAH